jgi:AAA+ ATPase superfamily predicted ATPase
MYEVRHAILLGSLLGVIASVDLLSSYLGFSAILISPVSLLVIGMICSRTTGSHLVATSYLPAIYAILSTHYSDFLSLSLPLFSYGLGVGLSFGLSLIFDREVSDELIEVAKRGFVLNRRVLPAASIGVGIALLAYHFLNLQIMALGSLASFPFVLFSTLSPAEALGLILASWFSLPYSLSQIDRRSKGGEVCLGVTLAVLVKGRGSGVVELGNSKYKWRPRDDKYCIELKAGLNYNSIIVGASGTGKSALAKRILRESKVSYLVFDIHGEYGVSLGAEVGLDVSKLPPNPLSLFGRSPRDRSLEVSLMLKSAFGLGSLQAMELVNLLEELYTEKGIYQEDISTWTFDPPTFSELLALLERRIRSVSNPQELARLESLRPYLQFLANNLYSSSSVNMEELLQGNKILDFSRVASDELKFIYMESLLSSILGYVYRRGQAGFWKLIVIDEAPFILSKESGERLVSRLFAEGRKFGLGVILISQSVESLRSLVQNASRTFAFVVTEPRDLSYLSRIMAMGNEEMAKAVAETLPKLKRSQVLVRDIGEKELILISTGEA